MDLGLGAKSRKLSKFALGALTRVEDILCSILGEGCSYFGVPAWMMIILGPVLGLPAPIFGRAAGSAVHLLRHPSSGHQATRRKRSASDFASFKPC